VRILRNRSRGAGGANAASIRPARTPPAPSDGRRSPMTAPP